LVNRPSRQAPGAGRRFERSGSLVPQSLSLVNPPEPGSPFPESFTPAQKDDLIAFLQIL
jgi:hypothetical protein